MAENGFVINDAELVYDTGRIYLVWQVSGGERSRNDDSIVIDHALLEKKDPLLGAYLDGIIKRELKILKGMEKGANVSDEELLAQKTAIDELKKIKEETDTWQR